MNLRELQEKRGEKLTALNAILDKAKAEEKRSLTDAEKSQFDQLESEISEIDKDIKRAQRAAELNPPAPPVTPTGQSEKREIEKNFSLSATLRAAATGKLEGFEREMHDEAVREARHHGRTINGIGIPAAAIEKRADIVTATTGAGAISQQPVRFIEQLQSQFLGTQLGIQMLTGLIGEVPFGRGSNFSASWTAENTENATTVGQIDQLKMQPRRVGGTAAFAKQLVLSSTAALDPFFQSQLISAINAALMYAVVNGSGSGEPEGVLNASGVGSVAIGAAGGALTWPHVLAMEAAVKTDSGMLQNYKYLTNAKVRAAAKATPRLSSTDSRMIWGDDNTINGYGAFANDQVPSNLTKGASVEILSAAIFGDWSKILVGQWGGFDVIADIITRKKEAMIEYQIDGYFDVLVQQVAAFAKIVDINPAA